MAVRVMLIMPVLYSLLITEHGEDGDDCLAEVYPGEGQLRRVLIARRAGSCWRRPPQC